EPSGSADTRAPRPDERAAGALREQDDREGLRSRHDRPDGSGSELDLVPGDGAPRREPGPGGDQQCGRRDRLVPVYVAQLRQPNQPGRDHLVGPARRAAGPPRAAAVGPPVSIRGGSMSMNEKPIGRTESLSPVRDDGRIVGVVSDPAVHPHKRRWEPINVDEYDNFVDDDAIEGKSGNYLFTVGNVGSGKSTLQSYCVHRLWSDPRLVFEYATADGNSAHDAYLNGWVQNIANGFFPQRTKAGKVREFTVRFGQARRPVLELGFIEIAGEEIRTIVPGSNGGDGHELGLS